MRTVVASLIVLSVLYFWDKNYNNGKLLDGLDGMRRDIAHSMFHCAYSAKTSKREQPLA
jgi:hypothetical protein